MEIAVTGLESISQAIGPVSKDSALMAEKAEAIKKNAEAVGSVLNSMKEVRQQMKEESDDEHKEFLVSVLKDLKAQMKSLKSE